MIPYVHTSLPYGYCWAGTNVEVDRPAAVVVTYIFRLWAAEQNVATITDVLNCTIQRAEGGWWQSCVVESILAAEPIYRGGRHQMLGIQLPPIL